MDYRRFKVSEEDKRRMRRLAEDLKEIELDEPVEGEARRDLIRWANARRAERGIPPLEDDDEDREPPEVGLFERAKSLGMVRPRREAH